MRIGNGLRVIALVSLVGAGAATPAWAAGYGAAPPSGNTATIPSGDATTQSDNATVQSDDATIQSDNATVQTWADDAAALNGGVIKEDAYLDEMGRRWDANPNHNGTRSLYLEDLRARWEAVDPSNQGLTPAEVSELTGNVDSCAGPTLEGSGVQPGNMGPGNAKGQ